MRHAIWLYLCIAFQHFHPDLCRNANQPGSDTCTSETTTTEVSGLELAFLIDQSSRNVLRQMPRVINIVDNIKQEYPGTKFGITSFADYACLNFFKPRKCEDLKSVEERENGKTPDYHKDPDGCYKFNTALTQDAQLIKSRIKQKNYLEYLPSGVSESGWAGVYLTAADLKMQWTRGVIMGKPKVIFVVTDDETNVGKLEHFVNFTQKLEVKGDGTDSCRTMHNPDANQVGTLLAKDGMCVFVVYATTAVTTGVNTYASWDTALKQSSRPYKLVELELHNEEIFRQLTTFINEDCVGGTTETYACYDPPMYNTLGL